MSSLRSNSVNGNCNFANQETPKTRDAETRRRGFDFTFTRDLQISENTQVEAPTDLSAIDQLIKNSHRVLFNGTLGHKMITKPEGEANSVVTQCHLCQKVIRSLVKLHTKEKTEEQVPKDFVYPMYKNLMTRKEVNEPPNQNTLKFQENIHPRTPHIPPRTQPNSTVFGNPMRAQVNTSLFSTSTQVPSSKAPGFSISTKMPDVTSSSTPGSVTHSTGSWIPKTTEKLFKTPYIPPKEYQSPTTRFNATSKYDSQGLFSSSNQKNNEQNQRSGVHTFTAPSLMSQTNNAPQRKSGMVDVSSTNPFLRGILNHQERYAKNEEQKTRPQNYEKKSPLNSDSNEKTGQEPERLLSETEKNTPLKCQLSENQKQNKQQNDPAKESPKEKKQQQTKMINKTTQTKQDEEIKENNITVGINMVTPTVPVYPYSYRCPVNPYMRNYRMGYDPRYSYYRYPDHYFSSDRY